MCAKHTVRRSIYRERGGPDAGSKHYDNFAWRNRYRSAAPAIAGQGGKGVQPGGTGNTANRERFRRHAANDRTSCFGYEYVARGIDGHAIGPGKLGRGAGAAIACVSGIAISGDPQQGAVRQNLLHAMSDVVGKINGS